MKFAFTRAVNFAAVFSSYFLSRLTGRVIHFGYPVAAGIEPNNTCNLHCPECPAGMSDLSRPVGCMDFSLFRSAVDQLLPGLSWITLYFQGEPYLNPRFFEFIRYARERKIFVASSTNGHFLTGENVKKTLESDLNRLIVSLDGPDSQSYTLYRKGGDFDRVINGIRKLTGERARLGLRHPRIILQCLLLKSNEDRLEEMKRLAKELGVDKIEFKTAQFNDFESGHPLMPDNPALSRYHPVPGSRPDRPAGSPKPEGNPSAHQHTGTSAYYKINNPLRNHCFRMWSSCVITWDGKVVPCCFDKDAHHELGDLRKQSFREIWKGEAAFNFRKTILRDRKSVEMCRNCSQRF
ncbi:MAG TPA: SPASM domain-containing protein [Bacteroidales bacterium]|nr:SPASM domain-containing protein [Bacteroidales bacterium]